MDEGVFLCRTCDVTFPSSQAYRSHAKSESHVETLRSRVATTGTTLPPASTSKTAWEDDRRSKAPAAQSKGGSEVVSSSSEDEDSENDEGDIAVDFAADQCLFCGIRHDTFDENLSHMAADHSFSIPQQENLTVDMETLVWYLNLVIYGYQECILCAKRRHSVEAIQHHMMAKFHCRFDISGDMAEFYDLPSMSNDIADQIAGSAESTVRLPSGKLLSNRNQTAEAQFRARSRKDGRHGQETLPQGSLDTNEPSATAMTRSDRTLARLATQLSQFRAQDQQSLAHLPAHELRAVLSSRMKQISKARRDERRMMSRLEGKGNKTLMKHFKIDVPGRQNG